MPISFLRAFEAHASASIPDLAAADLEAFSTFWPTFSSISARGWQPKTAEVFEKAAVRTRTLLAEVDVWEAFQMVKAVAACGASAADQSLADLSGKEDAAVKAGSRVLQEAVREYVEGRWDDVSPRKQRFLKLMCQITGVAVPVHHDSDKKGADRDKAKDQTVGSSRGKISVEARTR
jgi:hypothetical protein